MSYSLLIHQGSLKEAHIFQTSFWMSSTSGVISSSCHKSGVSTVCPLHSIHVSYSSAGGSVGKWPPASSLHLPMGPWKNLSTLGPSSGGGPRSNAASSPSHHGGLCAGEWAGLFPGGALQHLLLCPQDLLFCLSWLQEGTWVPGWSLVMDQLSHCIFSSKAMVGHLVGSFSKRTLNPLLMHLPIPVHMAEIQATFSVCRLDDRDPRSLLYWFGVQLIRQQRCLSVSPNAEGYASGLSRPFVLPPFSQHEWPVGTSPTESGGGEAPLPPIAGIHLGTCQCPCNTPSHELIDPQLLPTPWWWGFYPFYLHSAIWANCDSHLARKIIYCS